MRHLSLFSGSGIGTLAAAACGIQTVAHAENDPACCYCLERLWPGARLFRDVRDVTAESVADIGPIDIVSAGWPCQGFSVANKYAKGLDDARSGLWSEVERTLEEIRPTWFLGENSPAIRVRGIDRVLSDLERLGYASWQGVVPAYAVGLRHHRKRCWIVAHTGSDGQQRLQVLEKLQEPESQKRRNGAVESLAIPGWARGLGTLADVPRHGDGMAGGLLPKTRTALLRMVGNGWTYPNALLMFRAIVALEQETP